MIIVLPDLSSHLNTTSKMQPSIIKLVIFKYICNNSIYAIYKK